LKSSDSEIGKFLQSHRRWMRNRLSEHRNSEEFKSPINFESCQMFLFLGKKYPLTLVDEGSSLEFQNEFRLPIDRIEAANGCFIQFYKVQLATILQERLDYFSNLTELKYTSFRISSGLVRIGSCNSINRLLFSWALCMAPMNFIDYVVVHELVHTKVKSHGKPFWDKVREILPELGNNRQWIKMNLSKIHDAGLQLKTSDRNDDKNL